MRQADPIQRYARTFLVTLAAGMAGFALFNMAVDPYATTGAPDLPGLTERDTRVLDDGGRVHVADRLARGGDIAVILGSSRTADGFPRLPEAWPGGLFNAGMRGTNMFELAQAMSLAARNPELRCVLVGLDLDEFGTHSKTKPTYWLSALTDGRRDLATARIALSPNTFGSSVQLIGDNITGGAPRVPWADLYEAGAQRQRYENGATGSYRFYLGLATDPDRLAFFDRAVDALTANGVQVIGFFHPLHAWREEALFRAGRDDAYFELQAELARRLEAYADRPVASGCLEGGAAQLWDFSGFRGFATRPAPSAEQIAPHPTFYEPAHYLPHVGEAMLDFLITGTADQAMADLDGDRLTPASAAEIQNRVRARRAAWLETEDGRAVTNLLDTYIARDPVAEAAPPQYLNRDDWAALERKIARIATHRPARYDRQTSRQGQTE